MIKEHRYSIEVEDTSKVLLYERTTFVDETIVSVDWDKNSVEIYP